MFSPTPAAPSILTLAVEALRTVARTLLANLAPFPIPKTARRITRALTWLTALAETFAGSRHYHRPTRITVNSLLAAIAPPDLIPAPTPSAPRPRPIQIRTDAHREAARLRYMRRIFATIPTATLAKRLAGRLGLTEASPEWPHALIAITEPPAVWATRQHPPPEQFPSVGVLVRAAHKLTAAIAREFEPYLRE